MPQLIHVLHVKWKNLKPWRFMLGDVHAIVQTSFCMHMHATSSKRVLPPPERPSKQECEERVRLLK